MHDVRVRDVMTSLVVSMQPDEAIHQAAARLARNRISGGPVLKDGKVVGVVSEADLIRAVMPPVHIDHGSSVLDVLGLLVRTKPKEHEHGKTVGEVMNPIVISIGPDESIWSAASVMELRGVKRLPVVDEEGYLLGIISRADLIKTMARKDKEIVEDVLDAIAILGEETITDLDVSVENGVVRLSGTADRLSTKDIAAHMAAKVAGVVEVVDRLGFEIDDKKPSRKIARIDPRENWNADIAIKEGRR